MAQGVCKRRKSFVERTVAGLFEALEDERYAEELSKADGLLQGLDPRVKVIGLFSLILAAALAHRISAIWGVFGLALALALSSRVTFATLTKKVWAGVLLFTGAIATPAIFITPGRILSRLPLLGWPITAQGLSSAAILVTRVETAATLALLLILSTPWTHVLKTLRVLHMPVVFVVILGMTYRYIFLMLQTAHDMFDSWQSRKVGVLDGPEQRRLTAATAGVLLSKSFQLSHEVYLAMQSRGFRGEVYTLDEFRMQKGDWAWLVIFLVLALCAFWLGR